MSSFRGRGLILLAALVLGMAARLIALDRIPGINGDEAWFGANVEERIAQRAAFTRTPSGLPINPFHTVPLEIIARVAEPSLLTLRLPAAFWNVFALLLAYPLLCVPLGRRAAGITALFLALSPPAIAYSRIGWEPSETVFFALATLGLALRGHATATLLMFAASLLAHPTNAFLVPVIGAAYCHRTNWSWRELIAPGPILAAAVLLAVALDLAKDVFAEGPGIARGVPLSTAPEIFARAIHPAEWLATIRGVLRLVTGITTSEYIAGPLPRGLARAIEAGGAWIAVLLVAFAWHTLRGRSSRSTFALGLGFMLSLVLFHLVAGPRALVPHHERYALHFIVPACILAAVLLDAMMPARPRIAASLGAGTIALSLFTFSIGMLLPFLRDGGNSHVTFRTGFVEPKAAAFAFVRDELSSEETAVIMADSWWSYWPLRYLASRERDRMRVESMGFRGPPLFPPGALAAPPLRSPDRAFAVVFWNDPSNTGTPEHARARFTANGPRGRPILSVFERESPARIQAE